MLAVNAKPYVERSLESNYGPEIGDWTDEHTEQIDRIAHEIFLLVTGRQIHAG